jgi:hypothetical protein
MPTPRPVAILSDVPYRFVYDPARVYTDRDGNVQEVKHGISFRFEKLKPPIDCDAISSRGRTGKAQGKLDLKEVSEATGVSVFDIMKFFTTGRNSNLYGVKFVAVDAKGIPIVKRDTASDLQAPKTIPEQFDDQRWKEQTDEPKLVYCRACDKKMHGGGYRIHAMKSKEHKANVARILAEEGTPNVVEAAEE